MKKAAPIILCIVLLNLALLNSSICVSGQLADSPWPTFQGNAKHTGLSEYNTSENSGGLKWFVNLSDEILSSPVIASDGTIYVTTTHGGLYAIYPNGTIKWNFPANDSSITTPIIDYSGNIYFTSGTRVNGNHRYFLYSISPGGSERWNFSVDCHLLSPMIDASSNIYVGSSDEIFYSLYPDGSERWNITIPGYSTFCTPAIDDYGTIYYATRNPGKLYAIDPTGYVKWNYTSGDVVRAPTIDDDNRIYVITLAGMIYCINSDGNLIWENELSPYSIFTSPAIGSDGTIYVGISEDKVFALNPINGQIIWTSERISTYNDIVNTSPAIGSDGTIFFQSNSATLFALDKNGSFKWYFTPPHLDNSFTAEISCPAIGSDGTIYYGITDGFLYAVEGFDGPPVANFTILYPTDISSKLYYFEATGSYDNEDEINNLTFEWDFGDDSTGRGVLINHTYENGGNYSVTLTVKDSTGKTDTLTIILTVVQDDTVVDNDIDEDPIPIFDLWLIITIVALNLLPIIILIFVRYQRKKYMGVFLPEQDVPVDSEEVTLQQIDFHSWLLSRRFVISTFALLMILDLITTHIAISKGLGYEVNPIAKLVLDFSTGYVILLILKIMAIILVTYGAYSLSRHAKPDKKATKSKVLQPESTLWAFTIVVMIITVGNNLNMILS